MECPECGKETDKLVPYPWKKYGTDKLVHPEGVCEQCKKESDEQSEAGLKLLFGD